MTAPADAVASLPVVERLRRLWDPRVMNRQGYVNPDGPEAAELITELVEALDAAKSLIEAMQHQARQYVEPSGYTAFDRKRIAFPYDQEAKDSLFTGDMIYLLDGPEQRVAQAKIDAVLAKAREGAAQ